MADQVNTIEELIPFDGWTATLNHQQHRYGTDSAFSVPYVEEITVTYAALVKTRVTGPRMLVPPPPPPGSIRTAQTSRSKSPPKRMQVPPPPPPIPMPDRLPSPTKRINVPLPPPPKEMPRQTSPKRMNVPPPLPPTKIPGPHRSPTKRMNVPPPPPTGVPRQSRMNVPPPPPPTGKPRQTRMKVPPPQPPGHDMVAKLTQLVNDVEDLLDRSIRESTRVFRREDFTTPDNDVHIDDVKYSPPSRRDEQYHSFDLGPFPSPEYNSRRQLDLSDCLSSIFDEASLEEESLEEESFKEESLEEESLKEDRKSLVTLWEKWAPLNLWKRYQKQMDRHRRMRQVAPADDN